MQDSLAPKAAFTLLKDIPAGPPWNWGIVESSACEIEARLHIR